MMISTLPSIPGFRSLGIMSGVIFTTYDGPFSAMFSGMSPMLMTVPSIYSFSVSSYAGILMLTLSPTLIDVMFSSVTYAVKTYSFSDSLM